MSTSTKALAASLSPLVLTVIHHVHGAAVYAGDVPRARFERFFAAPRYEPPSDLWFEVTGVLQRPLGLWAACSLGPLWRETGAWGRRPGQ